MATSTVPKQAPPAAPPAATTSTSTLSTTSTAISTFPASTTTAPVSSSTSGTQAAPATATARSLLIILHGARADDALVRAAVQELKEAGHEVCTRVTFEASDVAGFVDEAIRAAERSSSSGRCQTIVAGGGDGSLNEAVAAILERRDAFERMRMSLALLPLGTSNDFAASAGISVDPRAALALALDPARIARIDVPRLNGRPFVNVAVAGGLAQVDAGELSSGWKRLLGPLAIWGHVLGRLTNRRVLQPHRGARITFDPTPAADATAGAPHVLTTDLLMFVAANSRQMGRTLSVCPDALLDDGLIDFTILSGSSLATQAASLVASLASADDDEVLHDSGICQLRASRLEVQAAEEGATIPAQRDGEPQAAARTLVFDCLHRVLPMHLPDDRLLVRGDGGRQQQQRSSSRSGEVVTGSIKAPHDDAAGFVPAAAAVQAPPAAAGGGAARGAARGRGRRVRHRGGLTAATLRRMLAPVGQTDAHVRTAAAAAAGAKRLLSIAALIALGGVVGWWAAAAGGGRGGGDEQQAAGTPQKGRRRQAGEVPA